MKTAENQPLLDYQEHITQQTPLPEPAIAPALPEAIHNGDELYFIGQHLEQYNHASRYAGDYYRRAVELDPQDYRNNVALGTGVQQCRLGAGGTVCPCCATARASFE
nr:hypothetical protein [Klebsiella pneumoniae subsp. pneumoniae]